jgi:hypothetical protein
MKCGHPQCSRGIGLVSHRRWFSNRLYCSRACRDNYAGRPRQQVEPQVPGFLAALFEPPKAQGTPAPVAAVVRVRLRQGQG